MLTFPLRVPTEDFKASTAARISILTFDIRSKRIVVVVEYGKLENSVFVQNLSIPPKQFTLDNVDWQNVAAANFGTKQLIKELDDRILRYLVTKGLESGTVE